MRVLTVNTSDYEGGAARAAYRLHQGFLNHAVDSLFFTYFKKKNDSTVLSAPSEANKIQRQSIKFSVHYDKRPLRFYQNREGGYWSINLLPSQVHHVINQQSPDIVHLHWVGDGFIPISSIKHVHAPVVWSLPDSWSFTGGCHLPMDCNRYEQQCGNCPQLGSNRDNDLSHRIWQWKHRQWRDAEFTLIGKSRWIAERARSSSLFAERRIEVIPNGLDLTRYRPRDKNFARDTLNLPKDKKLLLFGAINSTSDSNKGFDLLLPTLKRLKNDRDDIELVVIGSDRPNHAPDFGFPTHYLGSLQDETSMYLVYSACDVTLIPSRSESLSNMAIESFACGTPCVAFRVGGIPDVLDHQENGYFATPFETDDFAHGISWVLSPENHPKLSSNARKKAETGFDINLIVKRYISLYSELVAPS